MNKIVLSLLFLLVCNFGSSQDLPSDKNFDFTKLFEQIQEDAPIFMITLLKVDKNRGLLSYRPQIVFPLAEEKEMMDFSKGTRQMEYKPNISFGNLYQPKPNFTFRSSYSQQAPGNHKILKGYDYCLRPIY